MEIESKFLIDQETAQKLRALTEISGFKVTSQYEQPIKDIWFDNPERELCKKLTLYRLRRVSGKIIAGLKTRVGIVDSAHHMKEFEEEITKDQVPVFLANKLNIEPYLEAKKLVSSKPIEKVIDVTNNRHVMNFEKGEQLIELAIDEVTYVGRKGEYKEIELEIETKTADDQAFTEFAKEIEEKFELRRVNIGKYERAVEKVD
ncbi:MAG: CYTH domain-containing protein [Nanoarchaeota archaeon]|nr:CYTH domain-containing protein [Nanoarchaeota archaeon]